jgi:hypothetical protein
MRRHSMLGSVAFAALAACGAPQTSTTPPVQQNAPSAQNAGREQSWMLPEAKSEDLLYVANVYTITVYSYPRGKLVGTLQNFYTPYGECVDKTGDVYITDGKFGKIYEYAHGGTKPIHTVNDPSYRAYGCAIDPTTGNLAVANYSDNSARSGNVAIYRKARGFPKSYVGYGFYYYYYLGYDPKGNLYVDGLFGSYGDGFEFGELRKGGGKINPILLGQSIAGPGGIQWDGKYVALGDSAGAAIYQYTFAGSKATLQGTTHLTGAGDPVGQFGIVGSRVVTANQFFSGSAVLVYPYPSGGAATKTITNGVFYPFSAVVSPASSR